MKNRIRLLHISDYHARSAREKEPFRRQRIFGKAWEDNLAELLQDGPIDLLVFTGDAADVGLPEEFEEFGGFINGLLQRLRLKRTQFFIVPGNHDIHRPTGEDIWEKVRDLAPRTDSLAFSRWMAKLDCPPGFDPSWRDQILERQVNYRNWVRDFFPDPSLDPAQSAHGFLGYRATLSQWGFPLHIIGLDSAWLCGNDADSGHLRLTDNQLLSLASDSEGEPLTGVRLALMHHPLKELADGKPSRRLMSGRIDLLLHGHLHEPEINTHLDPDRGLYQLAAGCLYEGHQADRYPNACQVLTLVVNRRGCLIEAQTRFRVFSPDGGHWHDDNSLYKAAPDGRFCWPINNQCSPNNNFANPYNPWKTSNLSGFVGRAGQLHRLEQALETKRSVSLVGDWRIGKSFLLLRWQDQWKNTSRRVCYLSGEKREGASMSAFVEAITGFQAVPDEAEAAADILSQWLDGLNDDQPPLILVDEFGGMIPRFPPRFMTRLRGMFGRLCLVLATRREIDRIYDDLGHTSPFANQLELIRVGLLDREPAEQIIGWGSFGREQKNIMRHWAGRHPFYLQLLGHHLKTGLNEALAMEAIIDRFWDDATARLRELWTRLEDRHRDMLLATKQGKPCTDKSLRNRGLVTSDGEPFGNIFREFLREKS